MEKQKSPRSLPHHSLDSQGPIFVGYPGRGMSPLPQRSPANPKTKLQDLKQIIVQLMTKVKIYFIKTFRKLDIPFYQAFLVYVRLKPPIGVILAQHACHKFLSQHKFIQKIDQDFPSLLERNEPSENRMRWTADCSLSLSCPVASSAAG